MRAAMTGPTPKPWIMGIAPYIPGRSTTDDGRTVAKLSSNENPLGTSPAARAAFASAAGRLERYPDASGSELRETLASLPGNPRMATFLIANMVYTDALVALFAFGGIYAAGTFGWQTIQIGTFGILLAFSGTVGAWLGGKLDDMFGPKKVIAGAMLILLAAIGAILSIDRDTLFFVIKVAPPAPGGGLFAAPAEKAYLVLGVLIGMAAGPLQAASRTLLIRLAPKDRITQYFGLFALSGKVTSFMAPLAVSVVTGLMASQKAGMAVLIVFFLAGLALLSRVQTARA